LTSDEENFSKEKKLEVSRSNNLLYIIRQLLKEKKYSEVVTHLKDLPLDQDNPKLQFNLARAYQGLKNYTESLKHYSDSLKKGYPYPFQIYLARGTCYLRKNMLTEAENDFKKAYDLNPADNRIINQLSILEKKNKISKYDSRRNFYRYL